MKVTIDFDEEIQPAIQQHLDGGISVSGYVRAAVNYFSEMLRAESGGNKCGFGNKDRFTQYNTEVSPKSYKDEYR